MIKTKLYYVVAMLIGAVTPLNAQLLLTNSPGSGFATSYFGAYNLGYQFSVGDTALSVTSLGFYDVNVNGLVDDHEVGLWRTDGSLLASVRITSGVHVLDHGFAFKGLAAPVSLDANTEYILGAYWPSTADQVYADFFAGSQPLFNGAMLRGSRAGTFNAPGFEFPSRSFVPDGYAWIGANLIYTPLAVTPVPEPSTYALGGVALLMGLSLFKSHKRRSRLSACGIRQ